MRRIREILRLKHGGASDRQIARSLSLARSTVAVTLERAAAVAVHWPLPATLSDRVLEAMLYAGHGAQQGARRKAEPDWAYVHHELRRPGVTLMLLWEEYRQREPDGYAYSRWCELYRAWEGRLSPRDSQEFRAEVGHDRSKGARRCRDAKNLAFLTPCLTSCWPAPIPRRLSIPTA